MTSGLPKQVVKKNPSKRIQVRQNCKMPFIITPYSTFHQTAAAAAVCPVRKKSELTRRSVNGRGQGLALWWFVGSDVVFNRTSGHFCFISVAEHTDPDVRSHCDRDRELAFPNTLYAEPW